MKCNKCKKQSAKTCEKCRKWFIFHEKYYCEDCFKKSQPDEYQKSLEKIEKNSKNIDKDLETLRSVKYESKPNYWRKIEPFRT